MFYDRVQKLAHTLIHYSTKVIPGELVFIHGKGFETRDLSEAVMAEVVKAGGVPYLYYEDDRATRRLLLEGKEKTFQKLGEFLLLEMQQAQVFIGIRGSANVFELSDVPKEKLELYDKYIVGPVHMEQRVKHTRWCVLRYPNPAMCQLSKRSSESFQRFYYEVCCLDYSRMDKAVQPLKELMNRTDRVRIVAPETDLQFSIKNIPAIPCSGTMNIPDGECFTAPVRDSVNGTIRFNASSVHEGVLYNTIKIDFKDGKAVSMDSGANT